MLRCLLLLCFSAFNFLSISAQDANLLLSNPAPRAGEETEILFLIGKDSSAPSDLESVLLSVARQDVQGSLKIYRLFSRPGLHRIGPLQVRIDDRTYHTDSIEVQIDPPLPPVTDGIWLRQVKFRGTDYLVLEQRINGEWKTEHTATGYTRTFGSGKVVYAEVNTGALPAGLVLSFNGSTSLQDSFTGADGRRKTVHYQRTIYELRRTDSTGAAVPLDRRHFLQLPKNVELPAFSIR